MTTITSPKLTQRPMTQPHLRALYINDHHFIITDKIDQQSGESSLESSCGCIRKVRPTSPNSLSVPPGETRLISKSPEPGVYEKFRTVVSTGGAVVLQLLTVTQGWSVTVLDFVHQRSRRASVDGLPTYTSTRSLLYKFFSLDEFNNSFLSYSDF